MGIKMCVSTAALAAVAVLAGCGTTVVDNSDSDDPTAQLSEAELTGGEGRELAESDTSPLTTGVIGDPGAPTTTIPLEGSAAEVLLEIGIDMSRLSAEVAGDGDEDATIARIETSWAAITDENQSQPPGTCQQHPSNHRHGTNSRRQESSRRRRQGIQPAERPH